MFMIFVMIPGIFGLIVSGYGWYILGWIGFAMFFFNVWEIKILCTHCPYYAENEKTLKCNANYGSLKLWKYNPKPMNLFEKVQLIIGFIILIFFPIVFMLVGQQLLFAGISTFGGIIFFLFLSSTDCKHCVNFSCPLNRVPENLVREYMDKNPLMAKAWDKNEI